MDRALKNIAIYVLIVLLALFAMKMTSKSDVKVSELTEPQFLSKVEQSQVKQVTIEVAELVYNVSGELKDDSKFLPLRFPRKPT